MKIITESSNKNTKDIDIIPTIEIVRKINNEDRKVALAVKKEEENIALAIDLISKKLLKGGKLYYFGAGTSGRLGVLDASECPPTFNSNIIQGIIAGGDKALRYAIEGAEDDFELGTKDGKILTKNDIAVLISASGNPKYLLGVGKAAKENKTKIIALTCNKKAEILKIADIKICVEVGAEAISGSSRMKAGTAQKMVLNMLSTASMIKIGKTYQNFMIDVRATNEKLKKRAIQIVCDIADTNHKKAEETLKKCDWEVKVAILMINKNISKKEAKDILNKNSGVLRKALK